ncbi:hypothetical protein H4F51_14120 [Pectobacterium brasiliense]|uniref:hypothetical protein n=1 Tax=Pectobacterium brasiliense TaxID=180957 RepID=UPI0015DFE529|nr:hypothetical protein [Pectobacterium brasiliense]MBN3093299.1 hypothetical protein [Pectobacterium brasiliense]MBN3141052.1 hypothetical protein [Pectobacterium brasiliense]
MDKKNIINEYLKIIFTMIPIYLLIGCFVLWSYLNEIGMLSLFTSIIDVKAALLASTISFLFLSISVALIFTLPSISLLLMYFFIGQDGLKRVMNAEKIPWITYLQSIMILITIFIASANEDIPLFIKNNLILIVVFISLPIIFCVVHVNSKKNKQGTHLFQER